ncbi:unnamed protein product [Effrenium voratum]|uniref:Uncharacterized protein n=1 Tax=Effrenium voratum TaxID=2562239 RepID=A0AA36MNI5_9DINO|nr:unnamed protein product [Effrenium voratum]
MATPLVASAGYAGAAYFYNLGRYKFDAEQRQDCMYQIQNMRLAQWGLFREDVRDLFALSTANMDNYILVGALIVTAVMNFVFVGYPAFPLEPRWLLLLWNNCVFACITFGMVSVWLAMHGSIAQRSARVKILTQAVRPPVPSLRDVQEGMRAQESFEGGGARRFFEPPAFLVPFAEPRDEVPKPSGAASVQRTVTAPVQRKPRAKGKPKTEAVDWLTDAPCANEEVLQHLETADNGGPGRSAVMHSHFWMLRRVQRGYACFDAYARICLVVAAQMNMLLVCAYYSLGHFMSKMDVWPTRAQNPPAAWLALAASAFASTTLYKLDLFCGKRFRTLIHFTLLTPPALAGMAIHLAAARTNHGKGGVRPCDQVVPAWLPWILAILTCLGHACWVVLIRKVAKPLLESSGLPLSFRSTIYLDVFGWHSRHFSASAVKNAVNVAQWESPERVLYEAMEKKPDHKCVVATHKEASRISKALQQLLRPENVTHLTQEELEDLQQLKFTMEEYVQDLETQMSMPHRETAASDAPAWFQSTCVEGASEELYWVDCRSAQVAWNMPEVGQIIDLVRLNSSLEELQARLDNSPKSGFQAAAVAADALPFELMPENPDTEQLGVVKMCLQWVVLNLQGFVVMLVMLVMRISSSQLPWKIVQLTCLAQLGVWLFTVAVILLDPKRHGFGRYYDSAVAPREMYNRLALQTVQTDWPHEYFRPSALACSNFTEDSRLMLGDQFAIYGADLDLIGLHDVEDSIQERQERPVAQVVNRFVRRAWGAAGGLHSPVGREEILSTKPLRTITLEPQILTTDLNMAWKSFGFLQKKGKVLLLSQDGTFVAEHSLRSHKYVKTWALSRTLPHKRLEAIQAVEGAEAAECSSGGAGFVDHGWLLFAATDSGQVVTLCPTFRGELHPLHMVISLRRRKAAKEVTEVVDSHTGTAKASSQKIIAMARDSRGFFWLLETHTEGHAEVRALDLDKGSEVGRWVLPSGRWWVPGMCQLAEGQGFLLAAAADTNRGGQVGGPEIWRLVPS